MGEPFHTRMPWFRYNLDPTQYDEENPPKISPGLEKIMEEAAKALSRRMELDRINYGILEGVVEIPEPRKATKKEWDEAMKIIDGYIEESPVETLIDRNCASEGCPITITFESYATGYANEMIKKSNCNSRKDAIEKAKKSWNDPRVQIFCCACMLLKQELWRMENDVHGRDS